jgi:DNA-binding response OmpR family regulator
LAGLWYKKGKQMPNEKILIVDDERDIVELVRFNLKREGYQTLVAYTGEAPFSMATK